MTAQEPHLLFALLPYKVLGGGGKGRGGDEEAVCIRRWDAKGSDVSTQRSAAGISSVP